MSTSIPIDRPIDDGVALPQSQKPSLLFGPTDPPLVDLTLGEMLELQCLHHGTKEALVIPWTGARWTYNELNHQSRLLGAALLEMGVGVGDRVGIMAGNCEQYAAVFFAATRIGAILVILNNTYTPTEAQYGLEFTRCKVFFTTKRIGRLDQGALLAQLAAKPQGPKVVMLRGDSEGYTTYADLLAQGTRADPERLHQAEAGVLPHQVCNLQFTSGTTGLPKAASLTHHNIVNNARFIGDRLCFTPRDILCCPPPLFHCFGLVLGLLAVLTHGAAIVYPAEVFDARATLHAILSERCTALHGVPAMFASLLALPEAAPSNLPPVSTLRLRTGIIAGAPVPRQLMADLVARLGVDGLASSYGLTEASPTCFLAHPHDDPLPLRLRTAGAIMPHAAAKVVDPRTGGVVPRGVRGELWIAGYQLQAGYWDNSERTAEAMVRDVDGVVWLRTGDEAVLDGEGYCEITGRYKDIIIRGGENIYPLEIEERLVAHPGVAMAVVVGVRDKRYGEVVAAFLGAQQGSNGDGKGGEEGKKRPSVDEIRDWVWEKLGRHKAPAHVFWLGQDGVPAAVPLTGSGKVRKFELAELGNKMLEGAKAKL